MFEKASRMKLRFDISKGMCTVEDLWDLPLRSKTKVTLDDLAKDLNKKLKESQEESFVVKKTTKNEELELMFSVVKHIIEVKLQEEAMAKDAALAKAKKEKIGILLEKMEDEELLGKSKEELLKMHSEL